VNIVHRRIEFIVHQTLFLNSSNLGNGSTQHTFRGLVVHLTVGQLDSWIGSKRCHLALKASRFGVYYSSPDELENYDKPRLLGASH